MMTTAKPTRRIFYLLPLIAVFAASIPFLAAFAQPSGQRSTPKPTMDCYISERVLNPNKHTTCTYKCPNGRLESENVGPGYQCPPMMNVIRR
jgi:hypothetical protein